MQSVGICSLVSQRKHIRKTYFSSCQLSDVDLLFRFYSSRDGTLKDRDHILKDAVEVMVKEIRGERRRSIQMLASI